MATLTIPTTVDHTSKLPKADVHDPFLYKIGRHVVDGQSEKVFDLRRENGHGNSAGKANHDGIGDVFDDGT